VGRRGDIPFDAGFYIYIGSARRGFKTRLSHYLKPIIKPHWHIDHLLLNANLRSAVLAATEEVLECRLAAALGGRLEVVPRFGSSDCRCPGHLFLAADEKAAYSAVNEAMLSLKVKPLRLEAAALKSFLGL
jgi:Uri superfamily endonuclease